MPEKTWKTTDQKKNKQIWSYLKKGKTNLQFAKDEFLGEGKLTEGRSEQEYVEHYEAEIFDAINQFKRVFERTEWKKHRGINKIIKDLFKLEQKLSDEIGEL